MSNSLNLRIINFQDNIRSKPVRLNFSDIETEFNALKGEVDNLSSSTSTSEIISSRDWGFATLYDRLHKTGEPLGNGVILTSTTVDPCNEITGWSKGGEASDLAVNNGNFTYGYQSLKLGKTGTSGTEAYYEVDLAGMALDYKKFVFDLYIADTEVLEALASSGAVSVKLALESAYTNYRQFDFSRSSLTVGWQTLTCDFNIPDSTTGTVNDTDSVAEARISLNTVSTSDTIASGMVLLDNVYVLGNEFRVVEQWHANMGVRMLPGSLLINGIGLYITFYASSCAMDVPAGGSAGDIRRIDAIRIASNTVVSVVTGIESDSPVPPEAGDAYLLLAWVYHRNGEGCIKLYDDGSNGYIVDRRSIPDEKRWSHESVYVTDLVGYKDAAGPIDIITYSYSDVMDLSFTPKIDGTYLFSWCFDLAPSGSSTDRVFARVIDDTGSITREYSIEHTGAGTGSYHNYSGFKLKTLTRGTAYTFTIQGMIQGVLCASFCHVRMMIRKVQP